MTHKLEIPEQITRTDEIEALLREYLVWSVPLFNKQNNLDVDLEEAVSNAMGGLTECTPPDGCTVLARSSAGTADAVGFFRRIRPDAAEIKRVFLRPEVRGKGLGRKLVLQLIEEARQRGYYEIYLDTADFMSSAHALYRSLGFKDIEGYPEAAHRRDESPHVVYMVLRL
ncbi:MAG: GNAT family N-acetyltransferase [Paracoccaceae bacterium]